jgi:hypothetical protein
VDGRKLIVQVLQKEEQIAADDILISLRVASYFGDDKALSGQIELPMQRSNTIKHLFERVLAMYPNLQEPIPEELAVPADGTDYSETIPELKLARNYHVRNYFNIPFYRTCKVYRACSRIFLRACSDSEELSKAEME